MKKLLIIISILMASEVFAQSEAKQDIGINMAGLLVKNQSTVAPSIIYKYKVGKYQLRFQLALDGNLNSKDRVGNSNNGGGGFGNFTQDSFIKYDPGKNVRYGLLAGIQKNTPIENTSFSYYFGLDFIYMMNDFSQSGKGTVLQGFGGFDTTKLRMNIEMISKDKLNTYGVGVPVGIAYKFGKRFYAALESKFVVAYQKGKTYNKTKTTQVQQFQEITTQVEGESDIKGFDFGIKPLTGLCIGIIF